MAEASQVMNTETLNQDLGPSTEETRDLRSLSPSSPPHKKILSSPVQSKDKETSGFLEESDPDVFNFLDYREFLKTLQESRKRQGRPAHNADFARRAKLDSPNYWGLILSGKRNLSPLTVQKFSKAAGLSGKAALYFENLVYFNQAKSNDEHEAYFERLQTLARGHNGRAFQLFSSQVAMLSNWYIVAVRELVATDAFIEDEAFIEKRLKGKITKKEARHAINVLLDLGFLRRDEKTGQLIQSDPHMSYRESGANFAIRNLHLQFLDRAKESLVEDAVEERNFTSSTVSFNKSLLSELKREVDEFTNNMCVKYGAPSADSNSVVQINTQIFSLTDPINPNKKTLSK